MLIQGMLPEDLKKSYLPKRTLREVAKMKNQHFSIEGLRNITETIGDNIRTCRKAQGLTQKELAEKMTLSHDKKITKSFLSICENGKKLQLRASTIMRICIALNTRAEQLYHTCPGKKNIPVFPPYTQNSIEECDHLIQSNIYRLFKKSNLSVSGLNSRMVAAAKDLGLIVNNDDLDNDEDLDIEFCLSSTIQRYIHKTGKQSAHDITIVNLILFAVAFNEPLSRFFTDTE